jgi:hypothetical protein
MRHYFHWALCVLLLVAAAADAQERTFPDAEGRYTFTIQSDTLKPFQLDLAARQAATATIERLNELFRAPKVMNPPRGFEAHAVGRALVDPLTCPDQNCPTSPAALDLWLPLYYFVAGSDGTPTIRDDLSVAANVYTNAPDTTVGKWDQIGEGGMTDLRGRRMYYQPRQTGAFGGFPLFDDNFVIITKAQRLMWLPVTREAFLRAEIRDTESNIARIAPRAGDDETLIKRLTHLRAELDAMPGTARLSQAWHIPAESPIQSGLAAENAPDARPVVVVNLDFLDRTLPRSTVQMITVRMSWGQHLDEERAISTIADKDHVAVLRLWQLLNQLDWAKLGAMVVEPKPVRR